MAAAKTVKMLTSDKALRVVQIGDIKFDDTYQRGETGGVKKIMAEFDKNAFGVPLVAQREDGTLWAVDGRQRLTAVNKLGWTQVRVEVFVSKGPEHEAEVFKLVNAGRTKLSAGELFKARLTSGDQDAWAIKEAVEAAGFTLITRNRQILSNSESAWKEVAAVNTLNNIYKAVKDRALAKEKIIRILKVVGEAWPGDRLVTNSDILGGIAQFYSNRGADLVDDQRLIDRLRGTQPSKVIYSAGMGIGGRHANVAEAVAKVYNKRCKPKG